MQNLDFLEELNEQQESTIQGGFFFFLGTADQGITIPILNEPIATPVNDFLITLLGLAPASTTTTSGTPLDGTTTVTTVPAIDFTPASPFDIGFGFFTLA